MLRVIKRNILKQKKIDHVDTYFGEEVQDPYRWLENDLADDTKKMGSRTE